MPEKKKILYVVTKSVWGGAQHYVFDLAIAMPKNSYEVAVISGGEGMLTEKLQSAGIRVILLPSLQESSSFLKMLNLQHFSTLKKLFFIFRLEKPAIIHLNSTLMGVVGAFAAFLYKALNPKPSTLNPQIVFTAHGLAHNEIRPGWQKFFIFIATWAASLFYDSVIVLSRHDLARAKLFFGKKKVIPLGADDNEQFMSRQDARSFLGGCNRQISQDPETIIIGTIAELTPNKGLRYLLEAARKTPTTCQIVIIGSGEEREKLEEQARAYKLHNIFFLGFVPEAKRYIKAFDIFVLPSLKEGLPYVLLESMGAGIATIATRVGGIPDLVRHETNGLLVPAQNPEALAGAIRRLMENTQERDIFGTRAQETVQAEFSKKNMIEQTIHIYESR